jgi:uncharacterized protein (DUF1499 family)
MNKKLNKVPSARTKADSEQKVENMQVSPAIAKPNVVCSQSRTCHLSEMPYLSAEYLKKRKQSYDEMIKILAQDTPSP